MESLYFLWKGHRVGIVTPKARDLLPNPYWVSPPCLTHYGIEFYADGLHMAFPVHVAFSMWTVLPLSSLVPIWGGEVRIWVSLHFLISRRRGKLQG